MSHEDSAAPRIDAPSALPAGARLGEFEIRSVLGVGGFGIVYLAFDHALEREVALKEYMPASLAGRTETLHVSLRSQSDADTFALGLRSFVNEARLLARFNHPSLLKVHRFWEANGTAYMVMPVLLGRTLKDVRAAQAMPPDEAWLRHLLEPLLGAIETLHTEGVYHRDIAPDNILIEPDGRPVLLDFGAARRVISDKSQTLTAILKPAYAPIEQYAEAGSVRQGPWTDIYALGATLHFLLLGRPPSPATARAVHDEPSALRVSQCPGCSENFLRIIDWMLAPRPLERPQSVVQIRDALEGRVLPPAGAVQDDGPVWEDDDKTVVLPLPSAARTAALRQAAGSATVFDGPDQATRIVPPGPTVRGSGTSTAYPPAAPSGVTTAPPNYGGTGVGATGFGDQPAPVPASSPSPAPPPAPAAPILAKAGSGAAASASGSAAPTSKRGLFIGLGAGGLVLAGLAAWMVLSPSQPSAEGPPPGLAVPATSPADLAAAAAPSASEPQAAASVPMTAPPGAAESAVATVVVPAPAPAPMVAPPPPAAVVTPAPAPRPAPVRRAAAEPTPVQPASSKPAPPPPAPTASPYGEPAPAPAPVQPAPAPPPAPAPVAPPKTPEAACSGRNPFSYFVCMERECLRSENQTHPDCLAWRKSAKRE